MGGGAVQNLMEEGGGGGFSQYMGGALGKGGGVKNAVEKYA